MYVYNNSNIYDITPNVNNPNISQHITPEPEPDKRYPTQQHEQDSYILQTYTPQPSTPIKHAGSVLDDQNVNWKRTEEYISIEQ